MFYLFKRHNVTEDRMRNPILSCIVPVQNRTQIVSARADNPHNSSRRIVVVQPPRQTLLIITQDFYATFVKMRVQVDFDFEEGMVRGSTKLMVFA
jgi:hypothetical protein